MDACLVLIATQPKRVMSDVVSIADLMHPSDCFLETLDGTAQAMAAKTWRGLPCWQDKPHASSWQCDKRWRRRQRQATLPRPWPPSLRPGPKQTNKQAKRHISAAPSSRTSEHLLVCHCWLNSLCTRVTLQWDSFDVYLGKLGNQQLLYIL